MFWGFKNSLLFNLATIQVLFLGTSGLNSNNLAVMETAAVITLSPGSSVWRGNCWLTSCAQHYNATEMSCLDPLNSSSDLFPNFHSYLNFYWELSPLNYSPLNLAFMNPSVKHFCLLSEIHTGNKHYLI